MAKTNPKEAFKAGFDAGYDCAITEARRIVSDLADRLAKDQEKHHAELKTLQADIKQLQAKSEQSDTDEPDKRDPETRLN